MDSVRSEQRGNNGVKRGEIEKDRWYERNPAYEQSPGLVDSCGKTTGMTVNMFADEENWRNQDMELDEIPRLRNTARSERYDVQRTHRTLESKDECAYDESYNLSEVGLYNIDPMKY